MFIVFNIGHFVSEIQISALDNYKYVNAAVLAQKKVEKPAVTPPPTPAAEPK